MSDNKGSENEIEIVTPVVTVAPGAPTVDEAVEGGLSDREIESAKKHGLVVDSDAGKDAGSKQEAEDEDAGDSYAAGLRAGGASKDSGNAETPESLESEKSEDEKSEEKKPTPAEVLDKNLDAEKENEAIKHFNRNEKSLYWRMKKEITKRQNIEAQDEQNRIKILAKEKENEALRLRVEALEKKSAAPESDDIGLDDEANEDDKPLTVKGLEEREKAKAAELQKAHEERSERARVLVSAQNTLALDAKSRYTDFDEVSTFASEIVRARHEGRLEELFPDPRERSRVNRKAEELLAGLVNADKYQEGEYNPADMAYELGHLHPKSGKPSATTNGKSGKAQATTPEDVDKLVRRRIPSAALTGGGGRRVVSYDDLTMQDLADMPIEQYRKVPKNVRDRIKNQVEA